MQYSTRTKVLHVMFSEQRGIKQKPLFDIYLKHSCCVLSHHKTRQLVHILVLIFICICLWALTFV